MWGVWIYIHTANTEPQSSAALRILGLMDSTEPAQNYKIQHKVLVRILWSWKVKPTLGGGLHFIFA